MAWRYRVNTNTMRKVAKTPGTFKQVKLPPPNHVWIELSSPRLLNYPREFPEDFGSAYVTNRNPIAVLWFYPDLDRLRLNRALSTEPGRWMLQLINTSGDERDTFFYDVQVGKWSLSETREKGEPQHELEKYLNTWRNRLRAALFLIQQNGYRPGEIS